MPAETLGELAVTIAADNTRLKKDLKQTEQITKDAGKKMSASMDKTTKSVIGSGEAFSLLERAAAATGLTWLSQIKSVGELITSLGGLASSLAASTAAYFTESAAIAKNTIAKKANARASAAAAASSGSKGGILGGAIIGKTVAAVGSFLLGGAKAAASMVASIATLPVTLGVAAAAALTYHTNILGAKKAVDSLARSTTGWMFDWLEGLKESKQLVSDNEAKLREIDRGRRKAIRDIATTRMIESRGLKGARAEKFRLFRRLGVSSEEAVANPVEKERLRLINERIQRENEAAEAIAKQKREQQLAKEAEKERLEIARKRAKQEEAAAALRERRRQLKAVRDETAALADPSNVFEAALFQLNQADVQRRRLLEGALGALKAGRSTPGKVRRLLGIGTASDGSSRAAISASFGKSVTSFGRTRTEQLDEKRNDLLQKVLDAIKEREKDTLAA